MMAKSDHCYRSSLRFDSKQIVSEASKTFQLVTNKYSCNFIVWMNYNVDPDRLASDKGSL